MIGQSAVLDVFPAIRRRWDESPDLLAQLPRVYGGSPEAGALPPYVVFKPAREEGSGRTNKGRYTDFTFDGELYADFDTATALAGLIRARLSKPELDLNPAGLARLVKLEADEDMRWEEQDQFWKVTITFVARLGKPRLDQ